MILQRLISAASKVPDVSVEVMEAVKLLNTVGTPETAKDIEILTKVALQRYQAETSRRRVVSLRNVEISLIKAKHIILESEDEDFV